MDINRNNNPVIWFRDSENPAFANLPSVPFVNFLNAFCPPVIKLMFGPSDTDQICDIVPHSYSIYKLLIRPVDMATHDAGSLSSEIYFNVYVNGVAIFENAETNSNNLVELTLDAMYPVYESDVIAVVPSAAPGAGKQVSVNIVGRW